MPVEQNPFNVINKPVDGIIIQYYIVNKNSNMSIDKICAQIAHGAQMHMFSYMQKKHKLSLPNGGKNFLQTEITEKWLSNMFTKIVLSGTEEDFEIIKKELDVFSVISDLAEVVLVTWPVRSKPESLKKLELLKIFE